MSVYSFQHLLQQADKHDVIFYVEEGGQRRCNAGFMKMLLAGVSEMWRARDGGSWSERRDARGRVQHKVDLPVDLAPDVLRGLQSVVFNGVLPANLDWKVLCILVKLADAEVMPKVVDIAATELRRRAPPDSTSLAEASATILWVDEHLGHINCLRQWTAHTCEWLSRNSAEQTPAMIALLSQLSVNSMAALGVLKAAWQRLDGLWLENQHVDAICRHRQVILENASTRFLQADFLNDRLDGFMHAVTHKLFGSPATILQSPEAIRQFKRSVKENSKMGSFWAWYIDKPSKIYLELMQHIVSDATLSQMYGSPFRVDTTIVSRLLKDYSMLEAMSADEVARLVLPLMPHTLEESTRCLVKALHSAKLQAEAAKQQQSEIDRRRKRRQVT